MDDEKRSDRPCEGCGDRNGHAGAFDEAACRYRSAATAEIRRIAVDVGADPLAAADLLAHLRGVFGDQEAFRSARYVIELGWRPVVASGGSHA